MKIIQIPVLNDNYIYILHSSQTNKVAVVDPALAEPVLDYINSHNLELNFILNTHHHHDHVGGNLELKDKTGCIIIGPSYDENRIPGIDQRISEGNDLEVFGEVVKTYFVPGHTTGHIAFYLPESKALFCGDTVFSIGCGRLFEGTPEQMLNSLNKLKSLPADTKIYCAHEYTLNNIEFALTVDPDNQNLLDYRKKVKDLREKDIPTIPSNIGLELQANPFFRSDDPYIAQNIGMQGSGELEIFTKIRELKDKF